MVWRNIGRRKQSPSITDFSVPPMLICTICDSNYISSSELQLARLLRCKIVECLHQTLKAITNRLTILRTKGYIYFYEYVEISFTNILFLKIICISFFTSSGTISRSLTSCERETDAVRWYSTSSLRLLNLTTHKKNLPCASLNTLKCCTPSEHLYI